MAVRSQIVGVPRLRAKLRRIDPELRAEIPEALEKTGADLLTDMKAHVPVSPGPGPHLRDALRMRTAKNELSTRVGLLYRRDQRRFYYWRFLNYGTVKMSAKPFLEPALLRIEPEYAARIRAAVDAALKRAAFG